MTTVVLDASALVALLVGAPSMSQEVAQLIGSAYLAAPSLLPYEASNTLRQLEARGRIDTTSASLAYADVHSLPIDYWSLDAVSERVWDLRTHVTAYDAAYVAVAEELEAPLITADARLARAHGLRCAVHVVESP